jgi:predicted TIM-barrel fold metal-dependent hydrolase
MTTASPSAPLPTVELADPRLHGYGIWDVHCHPARGGDTPYRRMKYLVDVADRMGVERMCIHMAWPFPALANATPEQFRQDNDEILAILKDWSSRAFGFAYLNPRYLKESLAELERCVANGPMVGIKLWTGWRCTRPELDPIIARCAELKAVIFHHIWDKVGGNDPEESTPADFVALSRRHPGVKMICGHTGGNWELGIRTIRGQREITAGIAGSEPVAGFMEMAVREMGPHRIVFGSDVDGRSLASQIAKVTGANISAEHKRMILKDNLRNLLLPILRERGINA